MRKIEEEMLRAIQNKQPFSKGNTTVCLGAGDEFLEADVYLYGNHLGYYIYKYLTFVTNLDTLLDYPTRTTTSRLRALGVDVSIKAGTPYLNGVAVT